LAEILTESPAAEMLTESLAAEMLAEPPAVEPPAPLPEAEFPAPPLAVTEAFLQPTPDISPPIEAELPSMVSDVVPLASIEPPSPMVMEHSSAGAFEPPTMLEELPPPGAEIVSESAAESLLPAEDVLALEPAAELPPPASFMTEMPEMLLLPPPVAESESPSAGPSSNWQDPRSAVAEHWEGLPTRFTGTPAVELPPDIDQAITLQRSLSAEFHAWLHNRFPGRWSHVPAGAVEPSWLERRMAWQVAAAVAGAAVLSLLPVFAICRGNLPAAPPWALLAALLAAVQLVFAGWMVNAPDWATARVQMMISAAATTIYAMALTLLKITPDKRLLPLGLEDVRESGLAPAWCGMICVVMLAVTWLSGYTAARWRREAEEEHH
jgi:hypothetical protein